MEQVENVFEESLSVNDNSLFNESYDSIDKIVENCMKDILYEVVHECSKTFGDFSNKLDFDKDSGFIEISISEILKNSQGKIMEQTKFSKISNKTSETFIGNGVKSFFKSQIKTENKDILEEYPQKRIKIVEQKKHANLENKENNSFAVKLEKPLEVESEYFEQRRSVIETDKLDEEMDYQTDFERNEAINSSHSSLPNSNFNEGDTAESVNNNEVSTKDVRKSGRKTKGVNHGDFFPSHMLNFKYMNSHIPNYQIQQQKSQISSKSRTISAPKANSLAIYCEPSTSSALPEDSTFLHEIEKNETFLNNSDSAFVKPTEISNEFNKRKNRGKKRKFLNRKERNFNCEHYIYRPDYDDCSEEELRKLFQYLKLRTKGFVRPVPQQIIIDNYPIQYFSNEASMKDCATFDAFDKVTEILNTKYPISQKVENFSKPFSRPNIVRYFPNIQPNIEIEEECTFDEDNECDDSSNEEPSEVINFKRQKTVPRPHFKIRGKIDIRNITFAQAKKEFLKPTSNGKYDGPIPVSVLTQARDDKNFDGSEMSKKIISLLEQVEAQPARPIKKIKIMQPLNLKEHVMFERKINVPQTNILPIKRTLNSSPYIPVTNFYKKSPSGKIMLKNSNVVLRNKNSINDEKAPILFKGPLRKSDSNTTYRTVVHGTVPIRCTNSGKFPILKTAITNGDIKNSSTSGEQTYKALFSRTASSLHPVRNSNEHTPSLPAIQRSLLPSSFNPMPTVATRRQLQIIGTGQKVQLVDKSSMNNSNSLVTPINNVPKVTRIIAHVNTSQLSYLKEVPRETYSKGSQISLLKPRNYPEIFSKEQPEPDTGSKAAMVKLNKPLVLFSDADNSTVTSPSLSTNTSHNSSINVTNSSTKIQFVRLAPKSLSTNSIKILPVNNSKNPSLLNSHKTLLSKQLGNSVGCSASTNSIKIMSVNNPNNSLLSPQKPLLSKISNTVGSDSSSSIKIIPINNSNNSLLNSHKTILSKVGNPVGNGSTNSQITSRILTPFVSITSTSQAAPRIVPVMSAPQNQPITSRIVSVLSCTPTSQQVSSRNDGFPSATSLTSRIVSVVNGTPVNT